MYFDYKCVLTVQDISCVGKCSTTVALPILSACGHETCILPTAILSTHTGGFSKPVVHHLGDTVDAIWRHWEREGIRFDAILTGYLGSVRAIEQVLELTEKLLRPNGILIVDPAMADHGKLYSGLDDLYAGAMKQLCRRADILLPNMTEAAMLSGIPLRDDINEDYIRSLLEGIGCSKIVLTGAVNQPEKTGVAVFEDGEISYYSHVKIGSSYYGTGDIFAACFTGALLQGRGMMRSAKVAADYTAACIVNTYFDPSNSHGVKFETAIQDLVFRLQ